LLVDVTQCRFRIVQCRTWAVRQVAVVKMHSKLCVLLSLPFVAVGTVHHQAASRLRASSGVFDIEDEEQATVLDYSNSTEGEHILHFNGLGHGGLTPFQGNEKNGTPWYRMKKTSGRGVAGHEHFNGLEARGDFVYDILTAHNVVREYAGIRPLEWSDDLEEMAAARVQKLAHEGCYIEHSSTNDRMGAHGFYYVGENLYKVINMVPTGVDITDAWYAEIEDYTFGKVGRACVRQRCASRQSPPCTVGHFTQVMWHESKRLGCARAECPNQAKRTFVAVCNYGEGGNIVDHLPFYPDQSAKLGLGESACPVVEARLSQMKSGTIVGAYPFGVLMAALWFLLVSA